MSWNLVQLSQRVPAPWRNAGGLTRELLALPGSADWTLRLSVAEVTLSGPFSYLPGVRRWFAVLSGPGVRLRVSGAVHELGPRSPPFEFDGALPTDCELVDGPTRDINLMLRRGAARIDRVAGTCCARCKGSAVVAVYANGHAASASCGHEQLALPPHTLAWRILGSDRLVEFTGEDALWMQVEP